jgi:hypothetical protein
MNKQSGKTTSYSVPPSTRETTRILGICGSLRAESYNRKLIQAAGELAPSRTEVELWDGLKRVPPFNQDDESSPGAARRTGCCSGRRGRA